MGRLVDGGIGAKEKQHPLKEYCFKKIDWRLSWRRRFKRRSRDGDHGGSGSLRWLGVPSNCVDFRSMAHSLKA